MFDWVVLATAPDGAARVLSPGQLRLELPDAPQEALVEWWDRAVDDWKEKVVMAAGKQGLSSPAVVPAGSLVLHHDFVEAWVRSGNQVVVDMVKARAVHMNKIRAARNVKLTSLDVPAIMAFEQGRVDDYGALVKQKQALRDLTTTFDLSQFATLDALRASWPEELT
jgi:hypothetical protein